MYQLTEPRCIQQIAQMDLKLDQPAYAFRDAVVVKIATMQLLRTIVISVFRQKHVRPGNILIFINPIIQSLLCRVRYRAVRVCSSLIMIPSLGTQIRFIWLGARKALMRVRIKEILQVLIF